MAVHRGALEVDARGPGVWRTDGNSCEVSMEGGENQQNKLGHRQGEEAWGARLSAWSMETGPLGTDAGYTAGWRDLRPAGLPRTPLPSTCGATTVQGLNTDITHVWTILTVLHII